MTGGTTQEAASPSPAPAPAAPPTPSSLSSSPSPEAVVSTVAGVLLRVLAFGQEQGKCVPLSFLLYEAMRLRGIQAARLRKGWVICPDVQLEDVGRSFPAKRSAR